MATWEKIVRHLIDAILLTISTRNARVLTGLEVLGLNIGRLEVLGPSWFFAMYCILNLSWKCQGFDFPRSARI